MPKQPFPFAWIIPLLLLLGMYGNCFTQIENIKFEHLTEKDGLSNNGVLSIYEDREGFIWFGTWNGLNKFDGYNFTVFQPDPGNARQTLSHNTISDIAEDKDGLLWLATRGGGLNLIDKRTGIVTTYLLDSTGAHYWNALADIYEDSRGDFWISGAGGLARFDLSSRTFTRYASPEKASMIVSVAEDSRGRIWAASARNLYQFDRSSGIFTLFSSGPSSGNFSALQIDKEGILWIGTGGEGLFRLNTRSDTPQLVPYNPRGLINKFLSSLLGEIYEDSSGNLWLTTSNGLQRVDKKTDQVITYTSDPLISGSLSNNTVFSVLKDKNGHLWVGTANGINRWASNPKNFFSYRIKPDSKSFILNENNITHLVEDETGIIWVGNSGKTRDAKVPGGGIHKFDPKLNQISYVELKSADAPDLSKNQFYVPYLDQSGRIWIGTDKALFYLDKNKNEFKRYPTEVRVQAFTEDHAGKLWFGGTKGGYIFEGALACFDPETKRFTYYWYNPNDKTALNYHNISALLVSRAGEIWISTLGGGVNRFNPKTGKFKHYKSQNPFIPGSLNDKDIRTIFEDSRGIIWVGTNQGGLNRFLPETESFIYYSVNQGLPSNHIESILEDHNGNLWIGTGKGLSQFNTRTLKFRNYSIFDGLPDNSFNQGSKSRLDGKVIFGTNNGFVVFHPDSIINNNKLTPVYITDLKVLEKSRPLPTGVLELPYNKNFLSFDFVALDFTAPEKNQYAYQLVGVDKNWVYAGNRRFASYTNLQPGTYTFKVKASNNDGIWNEEGAALNIMILPPWWLTWWAYLGYGLILAILLFLARRETVRRERLRAGLHLKQVETDKLREIDILKSRFFSNISHEFRTPLALIQGTVEKFSQKEQPRSELLPGYQLIYRSADRLLQLVNQLLDLSRLEAGKLSLQPKPGEVMSFLSLLTSSFSSLFENKGITYKYDLPQESLWALFEADKLEKIISNLLSNACKFTPEGGVVEFLVKSEQKTQTEVILHISVRDTGIGIPEELISRVFERFFQADLSTTRAYEGAGIGLALTKELVELHGGTISVESKAGSGTIFGIQLPLQIVEQPKIILLEELVVDKKVLLDHQTANYPDFTSIGRHDHQPKKDQTVVLVIEDNDDLRHFIKDNLPEDYAAFEAEDGITGWNRALELVPDLIISDVMMPGIDGVSLCQKLKTDERTSHIAVILLTAKADTESKMAGLETGADDYITKPFKLEELQLRVHNQVEYRRRLRERFSRSLTLQPVEVAVNSVDEKFLQNVMKVLEEHLADPAFDLEMFSRETGMSRVHLHRKLKALTDHSPGDLIRTHRLKRAASLLEQQSGNISEVAYKVGFNSLTYFAKCFKNYYGQTPSEYMADIEKKQVKQN
ncbi:two-component regulator propeller domain-containing protein [soil metagenome]